ncbi:MAG: hypothetical protein AAGN35_07735 [Bacteroidota bacterium]
MKNVAPYIGILTLPVVAMGAFWIAEIGLPQFILVPFGIWFWWLLFFREKDKPRTLAIVVLGMTAISLAFQLWMIVFFQGSIAAVMTAALARWASPSGLRIKLWQWAGLFVLGAIPLIALILAVDWGLLSANSRYLEELGFIGCVWTVVLGSFWLFFCHFNNPYT